LTCLNDTSLVDDNLDSLQRRSLSGRRADRKSADWGGGAREIEIMDQVWEEISTAPYDRDLELAVVEGDRVHALVFACRRTVSGWIKVPTHERISISPTHWRPWPPRG
jgi:hypothetical protein